MSRAIDALENSALKKALIASAVIALVLVVSLAVRAAGDWRAVGQTESGDKISISSVRVLKNNQRLALVRVEYKEPAELPQGGPVRGNARASALQLQQRDSCSHFGMVLLPRS